MKQYSVEARTRKYIKGYGFFLTNIENNNWIQD